MPTLLLSFAHGLVGRVSPVLLALQDAPHPTGGSGGGAAHPASGGSSPGSGSIFGGLMLPVLMMAFLFLFIIIPARKQKKEQESLQKGLQKGDTVITTSQMIGKIVGIDDQFVTLEISERVRVKFLREAISRKFDLNASTATAKPATADAKK